MKGDFTRFTFDRKKRYTRVLKQQGRVDLDADWNEQSAIDSYLDRVSRMDLSGVESGAPSLKPGFEVTLGGAGDLNLSAGRFYARGLICELFDATTYLTQPFFPNPPGPPPLAPADNRTDLVYLDVWQRHITAIEDPSIREVALEGPDTCTRVQTVFQVRISQSVGAVDCPNAGLPSASDGRLTTSIVPVPPEDDLCLVGATGSYRGLENRLYRLEIHDSNTPGPATFKWSRDNGCVVFPIVDFNVAQPTKVSVKRLGRDQVLTLHEGDYVEVLDDNNELLGTPGTIAQVQKIDGLQLTLAVAVAVTMTAHPKVRRWDQKSAPIPVAAGPIQIEDGIQISFTGPTYKTGDFWMFAARATDGTVEILNNELAQGIHHEYARLALVTWHVSGGATTLTSHDCRNIFPSGGEECCCCTVTVGDGSKSKGDFTDIQAAIDSLPATSEFAEVCILPGRYVLPKTVLIKRGNILIRSCAMRAAIQGPAGAAAFFVGARNISFESLWVTSLDGNPAIQAFQASELRIEDSVFEAGGSGYSLRIQANVALIANNRCRGGIQIADGASRIQIFHNRIELSQTPGIGLGGAGGPGFPIVQAINLVEIRDNEIVLNTGSGICTLLEDNVDSLGVRWLTIAGNLIDENARGVKDPNLVARGGIVLQQASEVRIFENDIDDNGVEDHTACGVFLLECQNVEIDGNSILDNGSTAGVIDTTCIDFQTKPAVGPNPLVESDVTFTLRDPNQQTPPSQIATISGFTGLLGAYNVTIDLPATNSVELKLFVPTNASLQIFAANAGGDQVADAFASGSASAQTIPLVALGMTKIRIFAKPSEYLILELCRVTVPAVTDWQGGIIAQSITTDHAPGDALDFPAGYPAIRVHDNVVNTPAGHSLFITVVGQTSVKGNSLTSNGARQQPGTVDLITPFGVAIYNLGFNYAPAKAAFAGGFLSILSVVGGRTTGFENRDLLFDGRVLFDGNQVAYRALNGAIEAGSSAFGIFSLDAIQIVNNQFRAEAVGRVFGSDLLAVGDTVCTSGNVFSEIPNGTLWSYYGAGRNMITSLNQSMHCLFTTATDQLFEDNNQVTISTACDQFHERGLLIVNRG